MKKHVFKSYGKINICLDIKSKREDGYHELDMIMLPIELHDTIMISSLKNAPDHLLTIDDYSQGNVKSNLATYAVTKLSELYGFTTKFRVYIHKSLPMQAGLGGGSSNAAFMLKAVNEYLKLGISNEKLIEISKPLGADVPFFINCVPSRCSGIGEIIKPITIKNNYYVLLVKPDQGCSTKGIYALSDTMTLVTGSVDNVQKALEEGDDDLLAESMFNVLQQPAISQVPEIQNIINELLASGLKLVQMSGSGSTVFALSKNKKQLQKIAKKFEDRYFVEITKIHK